MTWRESMSLTGELLRDPSSRVYAAMSHWQEPWPREAFILADLFDAVSHAHFKNPKPYPRPSNEKQRSEKPRATQRAIRLALAARGHSMN